MDRGFAAPHGGVVHDVVVQQREIVEHLDGRGCGQRLLHVVGKGAVGEHQQHRPQAFAASGQRIADRRIQELGFGREIGLCEEILDGGKYLFVALHNPGSCFGSEYVPKVEKKFGVAEF